MEDLYNLEAEQSILGSILLEPNVILEGNQVNLSSRDFYVGQHQVIYEAMAKIFAENTEIDLVTLVNELKNIDKLEQVGGVAYISSLPTAVPTTSNVIYYMKIVKELSMKRNVATMMEYTYKHIKSIPQPELLNQVESLKKAILESGDVEDWYIQAADIPMESETPGAILTGFEFIDLVTGGGLNYGTLTILTGEPSSGKSTLINQIIANAISRNHASFLYSGEMTYQTMMEWFVKTVANIEDIRRCRNNFGDYLKVTSEAYEMIANWTRDKFYIFSKDIGADEAHLSGVIEHLAVKKSTKLFVLDNLMTLECSGSDKYEKQINTVKMLKNLAKKYDLAIILVAHPNKSVTMNRESHVFEISGASEIPNLADYILKLERGEDKTVASILKNRITGIQRKSLNLKFDANRRRFYTKNKDELSRDYGYKSKVSSQVFDKNLK